jgi:hypothetical protein
MLGKGRAYRTSVGATCCRAWEPRSWHHLPRRSPRPHFDWQSIAPADAGFAPDIEARLDKPIADKRAWNLPWLEKCVTPVVSCDELRRFGYHWYLGDFTVGTAPKARLELVELHRQRRAKTLRAAGHAACRRHHRRQLQRA